MRIVMFYHSLVSDWNHGNAHFLRGVVAELLARGHDVTVYEPGDGWSLQNLLAAYGEEAVCRFHEANPELRSTLYDAATMDLDSVLDGADLALVHEWNTHDLVRSVGEHRTRVGGYRLLFHDTHHRAVTDRESMALYDLRHYDGALCFGTVLTELYLREGWTERAWTWHEAADTRLFHPVSTEEHDGDLVWIGNWGDEERTAELHTFLLQPVKELELEACIYGVQYPRTARRALIDAGIKYHGWVPNYLVPDVFALYRVTVHVPRRPYVEALPGIPTIRPFEAMACGIPLVCSPWEDAEHLFTPGEDYLVARDGEEMKTHLHAILHDPDLAHSLIKSGLNTIQSRHTCAHRVDELLTIYAKIRD